MIVALGIPEDEPLPFLQESSQQPNGGDAPSDGLATGMAESAIATDLEILVPLASVPQLTASAAGPSSAAAADAESAS